MAYISGKLRHVILHNLWSDIIQLSLNLCINYHTSTDKKGIFKSPNTFKTRGPDVAHLILGL